MVLTVYLFVVYGSQNKQQILPYTALRDLFLSAFAKLRKVTISFVVSFCPSARMEQLGFHWKGFYEIWYLIIFRKTVKKIQISSKSDKKNGHFSCRPIYVLIISRAVPRRMRNVSDISCSENKNTHFMFNNFLLKIVPVMR